MNLSRSISLNSKDTEAIKQEYTKHQENSIWIFNYFGLFNYFEYFNIFFLK